MEVALVISILGSRTKKGWVHYSVGIPAKLGRSALRQAVEGDRGPNTAVAADRMSMRHQWDLAGVRVRHSRSA